MENSSIGTIVEYKGIEVPVTHTQFFSDKVKTDYWQRVDFSYKKVNVMYTYKSDDLSSWTTVEKICELIDEYGNAWKEHMEEKSNG